LSLALIASFTLVGMLLVLLVFRLTSDYQDEIEQKLHLELAAHIVQDNALMKNGELDHQVLKHTFHNMMILGPSFEFYVLDPTGKILTYSADPGKVKRESVSLLPILEFLNSREEVPIIGEDPRSLSGQKIFSVAQIRQDSELTGYLYIIIGGEIYDSIAERLQQSHIITLSVGVLVAALTFGLIITLVLFSLLTRPLRRLAMEIKQFHDSGFIADTLPVSNWQSNSSDEIHQLGHTFNSMAVELGKQYQKIKTVDELRRELISYVSHDLRTPLASLQGYLETWQLRHGGHDNDPGAKLIDIAEKNARQVGVLIEQLFELAHLDGEDAQLNLEPIAVAELAQDVAQKRQLHADQKQLRIDIEPKDPGLRVIADIEKLERVFTNLIDNAIRHSRPGGHITIALIEQPSKLEIHIRDNGIGIPAAELPFIFDPHFRASNSAKTEQLNSGLGLSITRRILELHGTEISVNSKLDEGTDFQFDLARA